MHINAQDFVRLAKALAETASVNSLAPISIQDTICVLWDVINGRRGCTCWLGAQCHNDDSQAMHSIRWHRHFVSILEKLLELLQSILQNSRLPKQTHQGQTHQTVKALSVDELLRDAFASLAVEQQEVVAEEGDPLPDLPTITPLHVQIALCDEPVTHIDYHPLHAQCIHLLSTTKRGMLGWLQTSPRDLLQLPPSSSAISLADIVDEELWRAAE